MYRLGWVKETMKYNFRIVATVALAFLITWLCIVSINGTQHNGSSSTAGSCASCHTDGQALVSLKLEDQRIEIEPTPPPFWTESNPSLASYYILMPVIFLGYLITHRKIQLTTHLRF